MAHDQSSVPPESLSLGAWRAALCARGLRDAHERMTRGIADGTLRMDDALAIARAMDSAVAMLRETAPQLDKGTDVRRLAERVLRAFDRWRVAEPRSDESRRAAQRLGRLVAALEKVGAR